MVDYLTPLINKARQVLGEGRLIVVLGWMENNHDKKHLKTHLISKKYVRFYNREPSRFPLATGLVLMVEFVGHTALRLAQSQGVDKRGEKKFEIVPTVLGTGQIKEILRQVSDLFVSQAPAHVPEIKESACMSAPSEPVSAEEEKSVAAAVTVTVETPDPMSAFVDWFRREASKDVAGQVSMHMLARARRQYGINMSNAQLASNGYVKPIVPPGKGKISQYVAGPEIRQPPVATEEVAQETPRERSLIEIGEELIATRPALQEEEMKLTARLDEIRGQLQKIDEVERSMAELKKLLAPSVTEDH